MNRLLLPGMGCLLVLSMTNGTLFEAVAVTLSGYCFLIFVQRVGSRIAILECIAFVAALEILLVPALTYWIFPASMPIESNQYFRYALPAFAAFYGGIRWAGPLPAGSHGDYVARASAYLSSFPALSRLLFVIGLAGFWAKLTDAGVPGFLSTLPAYCLPVSVLYAWCSRSRYRFWLTAGVGAILLFETVRTGMFGELASGLLLLLLVGTVAKPPSVPVKAGLVGLGVGCLLLVQSIKSEYRHGTWGGQRHERTANAGLMADLLTDRLTHPEKILNAPQLFRSVARFNQAIMIGNAMTIVPTHEPFANGEVLLSFFVPLVPRPLWPGKPQTGGRENIRRFTSLPQFENTSINLSPLGEGYVNFGYGGILFSLVYGLVLGGSFRAVFRVAERVPSMVLWLPMLFSGCLTMETDLLSTWGSLVNGAVFVALLFWLMKQFGINL